MNIFWVPFIFIGCTAVRTYNQDETDAENLRKSQCQTLKDEINKASNERRQLAIKKIITIDSAFTKEVKEINLMARIATHKNRMVKVEKDIKMLEHYEENNTTSEQDYQVIIDRRKHHAYLINENKRNILTLMSLLDNDFKRTGKLIVTTFDIGYLKNLNERGRRIKENFKQEYDILVKLRNTYREYDEKDCPDEIDQANQVYSFLKELDSLEDFLELCDLLWLWICILENEQNHMREVLTHFKSIQSFEDFKTKVKPNSKYIALLKSLPLLMDLSLEDLDCLVPEVQGKNGPQIVQYLFDQAKEYRAQAVVTQLKNAVCTFKSVELERNINDAAELLRNAKLALEQRAERTQRAFHSGKEVQV